MSISPEFSVDVIGNGGCIVTYSISIGPES